jgi:3',5'-cyclic-AMP phosphodiesterase
MRLAWLSDIHLNFLKDIETQKFDEEYFQFLAAVRDAKPDAILISGDIAEAPELGDYLAMLEAEFHPEPIYFVLGNHDFYRGSIARQRRRIVDFCAERKQLFYLTAAKTPIVLTERTSIVGHDSWADGRYGAYHWSDVILNDYAFIEELTGLSKDERLIRLNALGDEAAAHLRSLLSAALACSENVVMLMHVPPFLEACLYQGRKSAPEWAPHISCRCVGEMILDVMGRHANKRLTVLCGHTHEPASIQPLPNVSVLAAKAAYGQPALQRLIDVP